MEPVVFAYRISLSDYRRLLYFNTFSIRRGQSAFVIAVWLFSASLFIMEKAGIVGLTQVMHVCFLVVTIAVPMLVVSLEMRIRRSRDEALLKTGRIVTFKNEGIQYQSHGSKKSGLDSWDSLTAVYETRSIFIIYKDDKRAVLIPKRGEGAHKLQMARALLREMLGKRYKTR